MEVKIINRLSPCKCGCKGSDPQHAATFLRVLRNVKNEAGTTKTAFGSHTEYVKSATVRLPWGVVRVVASPHTYWKDAMDWCLDLSPPPVQAA